jgi:hypothetical protein
MNPIKLRLGVFFIVGAVVYLAEYSCLLCTVGFQSKALQLLSSLSSEGTIDRRSVGIDSGVGRGNTQNCVPNLSECDDHVADGPGLA